MNKMLDARCSKIEIEMKLVRGGLYQFHGIPGTPNEDGTPNWAYPPAVYRCLGVGMDYRTRQEKVVYVGEGGADHDNIYFAPLSDWKRDFTLIAPAMERSNNGAQRQG